MTTFILHWPQIIWIILVAMSLGIAIIKHGESFTQKYSMWKTLIRIAITGALLCWGGFFGGGTP